MYERQFWDPIFKTIYNDVHEKQTIQLKIEGYMKQKL